MSSKLKIKQINSDAASVGAVIMLDGSGMRYSNQTTSSMILPKGTTTERPARAADGAVRFNTETKLMEKFHVTNSPGAGDGYWFPVGGGEAYMGTAPVGDYTSSRYTGGKIPAVTLNDTRKVADSINELNKIVGLLLPDPPPNLNGTFTVTGAGSALLASGATEASGVEVAMPAAGSSVSRITGSLSTSTIQDVGPGTTGSVKLFLDGSDYGEIHTFTGSPNPENKSTGVMRISDNKWGGFITGTSNPAPPGFYKTYDVNLSALPLTTGYHTARVKQIDGGNTYQTNLVTIVKDDMTNTPTITVDTAGERSGNVVTQMSSGVTHYGSGSKFNIEATVGKVSGQCFKSGAIITLTGLGSTTNVSPGTNGIANPVPVNFDAYSMTIADGTEIQFTIGGGQATRSGQISITTANLNGAGQSATVGGNFIVQSGGGVADATITAFDTSASRVYLNAASRSTDTPTALTYDAWASSTDLSLTAYKQEAAIVGGVIRADKTDYSTGYFPSPNPDYSGKDNNQYVTYRFVKTGLSNFTVNITGTYTKAYVALPGVSTSGTLSPNAINGVWWDPQVAWSDSGIPGRDGDTTAGCGMTNNLANGNGTFKVNLGTANTTDSSGVVFVRFKLTGSNNITSISFS